MLGGNAHDRMAEGARGAAARTNLLRSLEGVAREHRGSRQSRRAAHDIPELANVAGPRLVQEIRDRVGSERPPRSVELLEDAARQQRDVLPVVAQGWHADDDFGEAIE